jgi:hypothetical protein
MCRDYSGDNTSKTKTGEGKIQQKRKRESRVEKLRGSGESKQRRKGKEDALVRGDSIEREERLK